MKRNVTIIASSRIHIGLLDLGRVTQRTFGGLGFMLEVPAVEVAAQPSSDIALSCPRGMQGATRQYLASRIQRLVAAFPGSGVRIQIKTHIPEHVGLGSKTSTTLAVLVAAVRATDRNLDNLTLQRLSGRGGASGTGIHGFFTGRFIVDAGRPGALPLLPSSLQASTGIPTLIKTALMPPNWRVTLTLPPGVHSSGEAESLFFQRVTPIPRSEILEQFGIVYHGLLPALLERDLDQFGDALYAFSKLGFKAREITAQGKAVTDTIAALQTVAPCVGMSSMGPLVYAITNNTILDKLPALPLGTLVIGDTVCARSGFKIRYG